LPERIIAGIDGAADLGSHLIEGLAAVANDLAEEEVQRLDCRGALVERIDPGVPDILLDRVIGQKA
jgi:hypothetical protein